MNPVVLALVEIFVLFAAVMTAMAGTMFFERRFLAAMQERLGPNRVGPFGTFQVVADVIKLIFKEDFVPPFADKVPFVIAPAIVALTAMFGFAVVPVTPGLGIAADLNVGLLLFLGLSSLAVYSSMVGGYASRSKYSVIGGLRSAAQSVTYEVFMALSVLGVVVIAGSFSLRDIVDAQQDVWFVVYQPIGAVIFLVASLAEAHRLPFDLPESEAELVAGYHSEYSSMKFGLFFLGEYGAMVVSACITTALFLGGWHGPVLPPLVWFLLKVFALLALYVLLRGAMPRPRVDQFLGWGWKVLLPLALLNLVGTGAVVLLLAEAS